MKPFLLLIPMMLSTTAALADTLRTSSPPLRPADAQSQAAALLRRPQTLGTPHVDVRVGQASRPRVSVDAQAHAAALLSRPRTQGTANAGLTVGQASRARMPVDAQAQAAALLSPARTT